MLGDRLKQARLSRHLSLRELAAACGVTHQAIHYYERGEDTPGSDVLICLAEALSVSIDYFFRTVSVQLGQPAYRADCTLSDPKRVEIENHVYDKAERYLETELLFEDEVVEPFKLPDSVKEPLLTVEDAEKRADSLRADWGLSHYPIDNLTELLEEHQVMVIYIDAVKGFDGCAYPDGDHRVVVVNGGVCGDRLRFDLAHELGHLLLQMPNDWDNKKIEAAAHRFAEAFLVPAVAAQKELGTHRKWITPRELHDLKHKYGMAMRAWIYRAWHLGIVDTATRGKLFGTVRKGGTKEAEPGTPYPCEQTNRHLRLVAHAYADRIITQSRAAELLAVPMDRIDALFTEDILQQSTNDRSASYCPLQGNRA